MKKLTTLLTAALLSASVSNQASANETRPYLTSDRALQGLIACQTLAMKNNWNMAIVIVDRGEDVITSLRMDEALPAAHTGASLKANTALSWSMPTRDVKTFTDKNPQFKQFPGLLPIGGGEPIFSKDGKLIGAVGVAGGYVQHDEECAKAVVSRISEV